MSNTKSSKELIEKTFLVLLNEKPINEISVQMIAEKCGVNRNTFYYHYKNIPDLLESVVRGMVDDILAEHPPTYESLEECLIAAIKLAKDNEMVVYHIYNSSNRVMFERHLWHILDYSIRSFVRSFRPMDEKMSAEEREIMTEFLKNECFGFVIDWINRGMPEDAMDKAKILINFMLARTENV